LILYSVCGIYMPIFEIQRIVLEKFKKTEGEDYAKV
jgi:hypothetical protein